MPRNLKSSDQELRRGCLHKATSIPVMNDISDDLPRSASTSASGWDSSLAVRQSKKKLQLLFVEDEPSDVELVVSVLRRAGFEPSWEVTQDEAEFTAALRKDTYDVILADYRLPQWNGMESLEILRREGWDIPVIVVSGSLGEQTAVECIKQGAADYVLKDNLPRLPESIRRAMREKQLREDHRQAEAALELSNQDLEQFAYVASHDLQEPLRMVATYTQLLAERYRGQLDDNADKYIHYAVDGALRMQTLIQDLLVFSRIGRQNESPQETDCNAVLQVVLDNLQAAIQESGARIVHTELPTLLANRAQLVQLFQNLVGNAIKFRASERPLVRVSANREGKEWLFSIADNGIGIAPENAETIFVIFKRLHTRTEYPGSGIGLAICKKIVERHGGQIWVESEQGQGATFKFTLPAKAREEHGQQP